tara:strand:+ start:7475 stop:8248 length:774 start_codon:yes stop_codon:yes gene_type:complete
MVRSLNYPLKYEYQNVNLIITDAQSKSAIRSPAMNVTNRAMTNRIARFIRENPDFSNLLPLNEPFGKRKVDIQLTWTAFHRLTAVVRNFKGLGWKPGRGFRLPDFESFLFNKINENVELYGEKPWVIWETPEKWSSQRGWYLDYETSAWPHGEYVESFYPCGSCGIALGDFSDNLTSCMNCGTSIHGTGECAPWIDTDDYETAVCVQCYEDETGEEYGGYNRLKRNFSQEVAEKITDEDIRQTLTFIEETFNTFEWK